VKLLFTFITYSFLIGTCLSQENSSQISVGINHTIKSSILNEERRIQIYTPDSYSKTKQKYPVLYILDGQQYFLSGVSIQKALLEPRAIPEMIVLGITNNELSRYNWFGDEKEKFSNFLINEIIPFINSNYRTNGENVIFGWETAAYYASELLLKHPRVFNGAILSNGGYASKELVKDFNTTKSTYLYIANSKKDIYNIAETEKFHDNLKKHCPKSLIWKYDLFNDETHESLAHLALYKGLKFYYHNYGAIDNNTKNGLIWLAWKRGNFEYFNIFMTEFEDVLTTKRYASAYWQNRFGQFYLKHKDYQNAIKHFNVGLAKYPNTRFEKQMREGLIEAKTRKD